MPRFVLADTGLWTGAAVASIPIDVPPGPAGLVPQLSLNYSSNVVEDVLYRGGIGHVAAYQPPDFNFDNEEFLYYQASPFGYGWNLTGIPEISRVPPLDEWNDDAEGGFELRLNGTTARLVYPKEDPGYTSGTRTVYQTYPQRFAYVASTIETKTSSCDTSNVVYREYRWEVITTDGTHYEFGGEDNLDSDGSCAPVNADDWAAVQLMISRDYTPDPHRFLVTSVTEPHGNILRYKYRKESTTNEYYPDDLNYDTAVTVQEITYGGTSVGQHRTKVTFVEQQVARLDCIVTIPYGNDEEDRVHWDACYNSNGTQEPPPDDPHDVAGYRSLHLIDRIEVLVEQKDHSTSPATDEWVTLRVYNLGYTYHYRDNGGVDKEYHRALLTDVSIASDNLPDPTPIPGTATPVATIAAPVTPDVLLPPYTMDYYTDDDLINWLPLKSFENGLGGKVEYSYHDHTSPIYVDCWNEDADEQLSHPRAPVVKRTVFNDGSEVSESHYDYSGGRCTEKFGDEDGGIYRDWYQFLGFGTVEETRTDPSVAPTAVVRHTTTQYYRCRDELQSTCEEEQVGNDYVPVEPHPNVGALNRRQVRAQDGSQLLLDSEWVYDDDDLDVEYIGLDSTDVISTPWGHLAEHYERTYGVKELGTEYDTVERVTAYEYDVSAQGNVQWGNVTHQRDFLDETDYPQTPYRTTRHWYNPTTNDDIDPDDFGVDTSVFIVDRARAEVLLENSGVLPDLNEPTPGTPAVPTEQADRQYEVKWLFHGNNLPTDPIGSTGALSRVKLLEPIADFPTLTPALDQSFLDACDEDDVLLYRTLDTDYDYTTGTGAGNVDTLSTFSDYGYACVVNPYTSSAATHIEPYYPRDDRDTDTSYDDVVRALPVSITNPKNHVTTYTYYGINSSAVPSAEGYFPTSLHQHTNPNGGEVRHLHDALGRLLKVLRHPDDTAASPGIAYAYSDGTYAGEYDPPHSLDPPYPVMRSRWVKREPDASAWSDGGAFQREFHDGLGRSLGSHRPLHDWTGNPEPPAGTPQATPSGSESVVHNTYDSRGRLVKRTNPYAVSAYQPPSVGSGTPVANPYSTPSPSQYSLSTTYDVLDRPLVVTNPDSTQAEHHYGVITTTRSLWFDDVIDENRHRRQWRTDSLGRLEEAIEIIGDCSDGYWSAYDCGGAYQSEWVSDTLTTYLYDPADRLTKAIEPGGNNTDVTYDLLGRKSDITDPDIGTRTFEHDGADNVISLLDAAGQKLCSFHDTLDRVTQRRYVDQSTACSPTAGTAGPTFAYDSGTNGLGHRRSMSLPDGSWYVWSYDKWGRITNEQQHLTGTGGGTYNTTYQYKSDDAVEELSHPDTLDDLEHTYTPQGVDRIFSSGTTYVDNTEYTESGKLKWRELGSGSDSITQTFYYHNGNNYLKNLRAGTASTHPHYKEFMDHWYAYDDAGNLEDLDDWTSGYPQEQSLEYDDRDRLTSSDATGGHYGWGDYGPVDVTYDARGNISAKDGFTYTYHTDRIHAARKQYNSDAVSADKTIDAYVRKSTGCSAGTVWVDILVNDWSDPAQSFDTFNTTSWVTVTLPYLPLTGDDVLGLGFSSGLLDSSNCDVHVDRVSIDGVVVEIEGGKAAYDIGDYTYPEPYPESAAQDGDDVIAPKEDTGGTYLVLEDQGALRLVTGGASAYEYNDNGNMYWRILESYAYSLVWDEEGRLREIDRDDPDGNVEAKYTYDGDGKRIKSQIDTLHTFYVGDLYQYTEDCDPNCGKADVQSHYPAIGEHVAVLQGTQWLNRDLYWLLSDHLGSTGKTMDGTSVSSDLRYDAWGGSRYQSGTPETVRHFTGQIKDDPVGLYYYNARFYDPLLSRFVSPDALVLDTSNPQDLNRYSYARGNPMRYTDPTGEYVETAVDIAFIAYDLKTIQQDGLTWTNGLALAADGVGALVPFATGGGLLVRALTRGDKVLQVTDAAVSTHSAASEGSATGALLGAVGMGSAARRVDNTLGAADGVAAGQRGGQRYIDGASRRAAKGDGWPQGSLQRAIDDVAGSDPIYSVSERGKHVWKNPDTGVEVVYDAQGDYFRVFDPKSSNWLDQNGQPLRHIADESRPAHRQRSHFRNSDFE